jgi:hypothetical protein
MLAIIQVRASVVKKGHEIVDDDNAALFNVCVCVTSATTFAMVIKNNKMNNVLEGRLLGSFFFPKSLQARRRPQRVRSPVRVTARWADGQ